jgi:HEAT repeat protein
MVPPVRRLLVLALGVLPALLACVRGGDLSSSDPEQRVAAVQAAASQGAQGTAVLLVAQRDADPSVRRAAVRAFTAREGAAAVDALATSLGDADPEVVAVAARGLASRPSMPRTREALIAAYGAASPAGRAAIADALDSVGTSLRDAVELEARTLWERNLVVLGSRSPAQAGAAEEIGASARAEAVARLLPLVDPNRNADPALLAAAARGLGEAGDWSARKHVEVLLRESDATVIEAAIEALGNLGDPAVADALAAAAIQGAGRTAGAAAEVLAGLPQAQEVGTALCEVALKSLDPGVAARAAMAARERDAVCPVKPLLSRLGHPGTAAALAALGAFHPGDADVVPRIVALLDPNRAPDPEVRRAALRALGSFRAPAAATAVRDRATALKARVAAARNRWIAGSLPAAPLAGIGAKGEERLQAVLARAAGAAAGAVPGESAFPPFLAAPATDANELGTALAEAGRLRVVGAEAMLLGSSGDPDPAVRAGALEGLGALGVESALAPATAALADTDLRVRTAAVGALQRLGSKGAAALIRALGQPGVEPEWCGTLAAALGEAGVAEAVPVLAGQLGGSCGVAAAQALGRIASPAAAAPLAQALALPGSTGRVEMVDALAQIGGSAGAAALTRELTSDRPQIRAAAARALAQIRYEPASARLEALRSDYYGRVRRAAVEALAKLPTGRARTRQ